GGVWCPVRVRCSNRGYWPPVVVMVLGIDHGDIAVRKRHVEQPEQPGVLPEGESLVGGNGSRNPVPLQRGAFPPEEGDFAFVGRPCAGRGDTIAAERFHFVEVSRVLLTDHLIRRPRVEL